jgi:hypothetical protein
VSAFLRSNIFQHLLNFKRKYITNENSVIFWLLSVIGLTCKPNATNTGGLVLLLPYKLLCGGIAGAAAQTLSYPLDVTRRRMQLAMMNEATKKFGFVDFDDKLYSHFNQRRAFGLRNTSLKGNMVTLAGEYLLICRLS